MTGDRWRSIMVDQPAGERLDRLIEGLLAVLLAFMPLAFGAVNAWSEQVVIVLAAAISLLFLLKLLVVPETPFVGSWSYVPVAVFILVAVLQLAPLPTSLVDGLSPNTVALKTDLLMDLPASDELLSSMTLSFYPRATRHDLRLLLAVAAVFVVVVNVYRSPARIKRLLATIAAIGGGIAILALAQDLAGNGKIYWLVPTYDHAHSGTFINHSHYGQFMNLSMGAALALLFVTLHEAFQGREVTPFRVAEYLSSPSGKWAKALAVMMILGAATVFVSLTRGGMVGMLIAAGFTTLLLSARQSLRGRGWILVLLALGAFICVLWVGFDQVYDRLATLRDFHDEQGGRIQIVKDIALAWTKYPLFGVGLGTHAVVYPMFDRSTIASLAMYAENEYAQAAEETGAVGLLALLVLGIMVWSRYGRSIRTGSIPILSAAYGLGFGLLAILIHSLSDFGQHMPANAMLSAIFCSLLIVLARVDGRAAPNPVTGSTCGPAAAWRLTLLVVVGAVWVWAVLGAERARVAETHWNEARIAEHHLEQAGWLGDEQAYEYLFTHAAAAVEAEPDNIRYRHWLGVYKWLSLTPYTDPNTGNLQSQAVPWARLVVEDLQEARPLCPTFGATYCVVGEIQKLVLADPNGAEQIRKGYQLAPCDATACFAAARIDAEQGREELAFEKLARAVQLDAAYFGRAVQLCMDDLGRADLALQLAGENVGRLAQVSNLLAASGGATGAAASRTPHVELAEQAKTLAFERLKATCERPDAPAGAHAALASSYRQRGGSEAAIRHYQQALRLDYDQVSWRYRLAQLLADSGQLAEAIHEARICLRLREDYTPAKKLADDLEMRLLTAQPLPSSGD